MKLKIALVLLSCLTTVATATETTNTPTLFEFTSINLDAHQVGLGGVRSLSPSSLASHWGNPALLGAYDKISINGAFSPLWADISAGGIAGSIRLKKGIMIAPSLKYLSIGKIEGFDNNGDTLKEEINPFAIEGSVAVGYRWIPSFSTGISVRYVYESLTPKLQDIASETNASALLFDGGIYFLPIQTVALSAGFRNAGHVLKKYENDKSALPISAYSGIRYFTKGTTKSSIMVELEKEHNFPLTLKPAVEFQFLRDIISLRAGTSVSTDDMKHFGQIIAGKTSNKDLYTKTDTQLFSIGLGLLVPFQNQSINFDFATKLLGDNMGINFAFSGGYSF